MEVGLFEETFVFPVGDEEVAADGTANGELFVGDDTGDDESIAEKEAASALENAEKFAKNGETIGNMTQGVIGIDGVKGGVAEREMRGRVVKEEGDAGLQRFRMRQRHSALDAFGIDVKRGYAAAGVFGEVEGTASGAAADFEGGGVFREPQEARNFREFFSCGPAALAKVRTVGFEADFAVSGVLEVRVGSFIHIDFFGHGIGGHG